MKKRRHSTDQDEIDEENMEPFAMECRNSENLDDRNSRRYT